MFDSQKFELGLMSAIIKLSDVLNGLFSAYEEAKNEESAKRMFDASFAYASQLVDIIGNGDCSKLHDPEYEDTEDGHLELMNDAVAGINNLYSIRNRTLVNAHFNLSANHMVNSLALSILFDSLSKAMAENPMFHIWKRMGKFDGLTIG